MNVNRAHTVPLQTIFQLIMISSQPPCNKQKLFNLLQKPILPFEKATTKMKYSHYMTIVLMWGTCLSFAETQAINTQIPNLDFLCQFVECQEGERCSNGQCLPLVDQQCADVVCEFSGFRCVKGQCVPDLNAIGEIDPCQFCPPGFICNEIRQCVLPQNDDNDDDNQEEGAEQQNQNEENNSQSPEDDGEGNQEELSQQNEGEAEEAEEDGNQQEENQSQQPVKASEATTAAVEANEQMENAQEEESDLNDGQEGQSGTETEPEFDLGLERCNNGQCQSGQVCVAGVCINIPTGNPLGNPNLLDGNLGGGGFGIPAPPLTCTFSQCPEGYSCQFGICVPNQVEDDCRNSCSPENQVCVNAKCYSIDDNMNDFCENVECPEETPQDPAEVCVMGSCTPVTFQEVCKITQCSSDEICFLGFCFADTVRKNIESCREVECKQNEVCINGQCVQPVTTLELICEVREEPCPEGQICYFGSCVDEIILNGCEEAQCSEGQLCVFGSCFGLFDRFDSLFDRNITEVSCSANDGFQGSCSQGLVCLQGTCQQPLYQSCRERECLLGFQCIEGSCIPLRSADQEQQEEQQDSQNGQSLTVDGQNDRQVGELEEPVQGPEEPEGTPENPDVPSFTPCGFTFCIAGQICVNNICVLVIGREEGDTPLAIDDNLNVQLPSVVEDPVEDGSQTGNLVPELQSCSQASPCSGGATCIGGFCVDINGILNGQIPEVPGFGQ